MLCIEYERKRPQLFFQTLLSILSIVNAMLMKRCKNYGLGYIDNSNIEAGFFAQDGLHLNEIGRSCLANDFINFINRYLL